MVATHLVRATTRPRGVLGVLLVVAACEADSAPRASTWVDAPVGTSWTRAQVSAVHEPANAAAGTSERLLLQMTVERAATSETVKLHELLADEVPRDVFHELAGATPSLRVSSTGHAVALSLDGDARWTVIAMESDPSPVHCPHVWIEPSAMPDARALALGVLGDLHAHRLAWTADATPTPHSDQLLVRELLLALSEARTRSDDGELQRAWARALCDERGELPADSVVVEGASAVVGAAATRTPSIWAELTRCLSGESRGHVALALAHLADPATQGELAIALRRELDRKAGGEPLEQITWSLASVTATRGIADTDTRDMLIAMARSPDLCPSEPSCRCATVHAIRALARLDDASARAVLAELAGTASGELTGELPATFTTWSEIRTHPGRDESPATWARAAMHARH